MKIDISEFDELESVNELFEDAKLVRSWKIEETKEAVYTAIREAFGKK